MFLIQNIIFKFLVIAKRIICAVNIFHNEIFSFLIKMYIYIFKYIFATDFLNERGKISENVLPI